MLIFHGHGVDICGIDPYGMAVDPVNFRSKMTDRIQESIDIADIWEIIDHNIVIRHDRRR